MLRLAQRIDPLDIVNEPLARRRILCRKSVMCWAANCWPGRIKPYWHTELVDRRLQRLLADGTEHNYLQISQPPRTGKPVEVNELVLLEGGKRVRLGDVKVGQKVCTREGRYRRILAIHEQPQYACVRISTRGGRMIVAGHDHPFLTPRGWINASDLRRRDRVMLVTADGQDLDGVRDEEFILAGFMVGDGCVADTRTSCAANFTNGDPEVIVEFLRCVEVLGFSARQMPSRTIRYDLSQGIRTWLREIGLAKKNSFQKRVPAFVFRGSPRQVQLFVDAYFACDGHICLRKQKGIDRDDCRLEFYSVSRGLLEDVRHLLVRLGVGANLKIKNGMYLDQRHQSWRLSFGSTDDCWRYKQRANIPGAKQKRLDDYEPVATEFEPIIKDEIVSIEDGGLADCRCLEVEEDHTFTVNDVVVHNSMMALLFTGTHYLATHPNHHVWVVTHNQTMANKFGRQAKNIFAAHAPEIFGVKLDPKAKANSNWAVEGYEGSFNAIGWGGPITGNKVHLLILDDLIKNSKEALSVTIRDDIWDWWDGTATQRIQNNIEIQTKVVSIQCLSGDTQISMANGQRKAISEIDPGEMVLSYRQATHELVSDRVTYAGPAGTDKTLKVVTACGVLEANAKHPLLLAGYEGNVWTPAGDIKVGHLVICISPDTKALQKYEVLDIEPGTDKPVYDLSIETNESFIANNFVVHNTRWHVDDLNGRLIQQERSGGAMRWDKLILPAIADKGEIYDPETGRVLMRHGEVLCPEILSFESCEAIRRTKSRYWWECNYQQRPITQDGILWSSDCFPDENFVDEWPKRMKYLVVGVDPATGRALRDGDYSAIVALGVAFDGKIYAQADLEKSGPLETTERLARFCRALPMPPDIIAIEANGFQFLVGTMAAETLHNWNVAGRIMDYKTDERGVPQHKEDRIAELDPLIVSKSIHWVRGEGTQLCVSQLQNFPSQDHDDGPDALELASWVLGNLN